MVHKGIIAVVKENKYLILMNYISNGCLPKAAKVLRNVIVTLRLRLPPRRYVQILLPPPPGLHPVTKRPSCRATLCDNSSLARPKAHC